MFVHKIKISSSRKIEVINITEEVLNAVKKSKVKDGLVHVFVPHATAALILNEHESGLLQDYEKWIKQFFKGDWKHDLIDDNASSHLASAFIGQSKTLPLIDSKILRGTWQEILVLELDGPRNSRFVVVQIL